MIANKVYEHMNTQQSFVETKYRQRGKQFRLSILLCV
jgi:hypothetical protein